MRTVTPPLGTVSVTGLLVCRHVFWLTPVSFSGDMSGHTCSKARVVRTGSREPKSRGAHDFQSEAVELAVVLQRAEDRKVFRRTSIQMRIVTYPLSGRADVASGPADEQRPRSIPGAAPSAGRFAGAVDSVSLEGSSVAG